MVLTAERTQQLLQLWDEHIATEFTEKSADAAVATMVPHATVNHVPTQTGWVCGVGGATGPKQHHRQLLLLHH
jgi:hypothetical protein